MSRADPSHKMAFPLPDKPSIAVLPFVNMSDDKSQEYFSDGLTEEIITALAKTPKVFVIARESSFTYKGKPVKVQQVSEELGVRYVLEGSVRREGNRVRITAQLIDATTGNHLWADRYDRELKEVFAIQDEITLKIISAMPVKLTSGESASLYETGTESLEAYLKLLEGIEPMATIDVNAIASARKKFEEAIALDPKFAKAYALLGLTYGYDFALGVKREESIKKAFECLEKARSLDASNLNTYTALEWMYDFLRQHEKAIASAEKALSIAPGSAFAHFSMGRALNFACRDKEALIYLEKAVRMNPFPPGYYFQHIGAAHFNLGNHEEAVSALKRTLSMNPLNHFARSVLIVVYVEMGRMEEASVEGQELAKDLPGPPRPPEAYRKISFWKDPKVTERWVEASRKLRSYLSQQ